MKVRVYTPNKKVYYHIRNEGVYIVAREHGEDTYVLENDNNSITYVEKAWCRIVPEYHFELPEDLFE